MSSSMFLKIDGISGESKDPAHRGEIEVLGWAFCASHSGSFSFGPEHEEGKPSLTDFTIQKYLDASSPAILLNCLKGTVLKKVVLSVRKGDHGTPENLVITLEDVLVTCVQPSGSRSGDQPYESVSFNYAQIKMDYISQEDTGASATRHTVGYNIVRKTEV